MPHRSRKGTTITLAGAGAAVLGLSSLLVWSPISAAASPPSTNLAVTAPMSESLAPAPPLKMLYAGQPLTAQQRHSLKGIAKRTWKFFSIDVNPQTDLPMDNVGFQGAPAQGAYTSPTDIAMYLWSITAAAQMHIIPAHQGYALANRELQAIQKLQKWNGFLLSWYDTNTGAAINGPGQGPITSTTGQFISTVDNGWYASSLIVVRNAFPGLAPQASKLLKAMNFGIFYDNGDQATNITAGQMYGGYYAGEGPASFEYGNLNTDPRIAAYVGMGTGTLPGDVWWRTWRTLPADFTWQTQVPNGPTVTYTDPYSGKSFSVVEGHYTYDGITYVPSWGGSEFEALMAPLVVPESTWGQKSFGLNDINYAQASIDYATQALKYPVWGLSPASVPGTTGNYAAYGAYPMGSGGTGNAYANTAVTPYASFLALPFVPQEAFQNIQKLQSLYNVYGRYGFYDAVNPVTGTVAPRYLVLDQGMIMAGIDDALMQGGLQRYFAEDPVGQHDKAYLEMERFSITPAPGLVLHNGDQ
ncbi:glucoamylase family protein [Sulfobacillus sp. hq2]|uniref:glucoamylase family protein n=1 Tax=Sulfobacillus TaxID=28033 RepID=UPI001FA89AF2|nr:glucoamylase family protein [Sulfobacillus sp. hq2]